MTDAFKPLSEHRQAHAEGVIWDDLANVVRWTDIATSQLFAYDPATGRVTDEKLPARVCCFALTHQKGVLLLAMEKQVARYDTRDGTLTVLEDIEPEILGTRANDGRCDRAGNLVFGTLNERGPEKVASFWRYTREGKLHRLALPKAAITNSICFSPDGETMYFTDSPTAQIMACDYDAASGEVDRIRVFTELRKGMEPDGSTIDADGFLWNAEWGASRVVRYAPDGRIDSTIELPARQPSCVTFAGPALDRMVITSAFKYLDEAVVKQEPRNGAIFIGTPPRGHGLPEARYGDEVAA
ncbi:SMP-30/gluconolactonase/LRE family protein [Luteibacter aegosomatissinici]|uniref:SMP-30/gluconolactonase/LRE family protein n=1 Tax=Luteibacter aegosomatissinici TaxID=2911539 RepID=UPI001FFB4252|nr:SMP-30/gluconolactonase/LRE family protein [Luteibacter aegosomatissinici]UPG94117.1 SMP-30/gluconolactonase/LRE family protein [Luteibacter aegosomatissinici]